MADHEKQKLTKEERTAVLAELRDKQRAWVESYLACWNATQAAREAGYKGSDDTLRQVGHDNLTKPNIRRLIDDRLAQLIMSADEVLTRHTEIARSSIEDFIKIDMDGGTRLDLAKAKEAGKLGLIKSITPTRYGFKLELHDAQAAQVQLGRYHKLWTDKVEHTGKDGEPLFKVYEDVRVEDV